MLLGSHLVFTDRSNYILTFLINGNTQEGRTLCGLLDVPRSGSTMGTFYMVFSTNAAVKEFINTFKPGLLHYQMWKKGDI